MIIVNDDKPEAGVFVIDLDNYKVYMSDKITSEQANITDIYYENGAVYYSTVRFGDDVIAAFAKERFGELGGYAQQYLFYYGKTVKMGVANKNKK